MTHSNRHPLRDMNGATLRAVRSRAGLTLNQFGALVNVSGNTVSKWELDARLVYADVEDMAIDVNEEYMAAYAAAEEAPELTIIRSGGSTAPLTDNAPDDRAVLRVIHNAARGDAALDLSTPLEWDDEDGYDQ